MELIELKAKSRTATGNGPARVLRTEGRIPAVIYGPDTPSTPLSVEVIALEKVLKKGGIQALINLVMEDGAGTGPKTVMLKELQTDPLSNFFVHADFYEISMDRKITASVPIITTGESIGVERGGILQIVRRDLDVSCFPNKIPESFELDISGLDIGDAIHVGEIPVEEGIEILAEKEFTVVTVATPMREEEPEVEEEEAEELGEGAEGEAEGEAEASEVKPGE